ncbi:hypothetical protein BDA96_02G201300 [Sorghum bicolor]|uniref:BED-type domain-containing protein n=2 Tax=Sorghum bicolor TaxID=4558 RepID=A0A1B6QC97_SORBI|nr:zinc finger BED domain-containing protein RICESLEEPER 2 [Sorghum bicolor]XP_021308649.1 zinc finger BED domain-containing protein RICESLEEPER 2 [Sorghum bicolor]KAG0543568.1 hypothetical protein BDA96_02G201300 [Sorghum bicolor]KXG35552.1 hypothetical protein SORBI_3002G190400 [Sorghum bicolor]OQU89441.1 hypothetical protein SORBI_3002G190400 [Sorghum bicolor]OQU89442.1 hypothetical protein SORBI_3002G190400 [Sorghum bicolor]|eukprot:XP_021308648.1 zinc finger BED domain-containing protein RICESLEEPER 2 [Sorghum bicolor]
MERLCRLNCMHCHRVFNYNSTNGTTGLRNHQAKCSPRTQKRVKPLPSTNKSTPANSSDPKQKKLPFLLSRQNKCTGTADAVPVQELAFPDAHTNKNNKNQEVDQNGSHEVLAAPEVSTDQHKNQPHGEIALPEQDFPNDLSQKNQKVYQNCSPEELVRILAIHGHLPRMMEQDGFRKVAACLNPMVNMPSHHDFIGNICDLFQQEKSKLKEKLAALRGRVCLSAYMWHYDPHLAFLCLTIHYIDDEWEKQQKIITFSPMDPSCDAKQYSDIIVGAIREWDLHDKVFSIIVDDVFIDDSVASNIKTSLQKWNKVNANRNLFVVCSATHLLDQVIHVGLDELNKIIEKSAKCAKYAKGSNCSAVQYPNIRYAASPEDWSTASEISEILEHFHEYINWMPIFPSPSDLFDTLKNVYSKVHCSSRYRTDKASKWWKRVNRSSRNAGNSVSYIFVCLW